MKALPLSPAAPVIGDEVFSVGNVQGLGWVAINGVFSAIRPADEIPNFGTGFRVIQFTAQVGPGASGSPLVNAKGELLGIVTKGGPSGQFFAIPVESIINLADLPTRTALGSGSNLQLPAAAEAKPSPASAAAANAKAGDIARNSKTAIVTSRSVFFTPDTLVRELQKEKDFQALARDNLGDRSQNCRSCFSRGPALVYVQVHI